MQQKLPIVFASILAVLIVSALAWLGFSNWQLQQELKEFKKQDTHSGSIAAQQLSDPLARPRDPLDPFYAMQQRMDAMMESFSSGSFFNGSDRLLANSQPVVDMREHKDRYEVVINIPDGQNIDLKTELEDNRLWISGQVQSKQSQTTAQGRVNMSNMSQFSRSFYFPEEIDAGAMRTKENDKEITITIPKK